MAKEQQRQLAQFWARQCKRMLQERNNLSRDDLEYVVEKINSMRDERLKQCVTTLIGWGDEERAEFETFCAIAVEVIKNAAPSVVRDAARIVEIRSLTKK